MDFETLTLKNSLWNISTTRQVHLSSIYIYSIVLHRRIQRLEMPTVVL